MINATKILPNGTERFGLYRADDVERNFTPKLDSVVEYWE